LRRLRTEGHEIRDEDIARLSPLKHRNLNVLGVLHTGRLALRIHDGAFSAMDLTARHPRTGELLSTVKFWCRPSRPPANSSAN
jgi:hypothetical protein